MMNCPPKLNLDLNLLILFTRSGHVPPTIRLYFGVMLTVLRTMNSCHDELIPTTMRVSMHVSLGTNT